MKTQTPRLNHPYTDLNGGTWLKGNLHAHTTNSDGHRPMQRVIDVYAGLGHEFLMLSDHDRFTSPADLANADARGMVLIPGTEISANGPHLLHVGAGGPVEPNADRQQVIDDIGKAGGFAVYNHPNWFARFDHCPQKVLEESEGYAGIEIYNWVISRLPGSEYATDRWDMLLSTGKHAWGFANDDSHRADGEDGHGWNVAYVRERSPAGVIGALAAGRFYASTGVVIRDISVDGAGIEIITENAQKIVAYRDNGVRFAQVDGAAIAVEVPQETAYVRFECWGAGESFAWTQPFFVE
jgi:hypothetical protein